MNFLIVDDHALNREVLRMQLEAEGHRVLEATNGFEALEILDRESVDGVVSDILMPGMDGFQLCLEIRKRKNLARLPFIFYTGTFKSPKDREFARSIGVDQYLTKPSTPREILGALEQAMQRTRDRIAVSAAKHDVTYVLKQYNESLVRKLEEQNLELQETLKNLQIAHDSKQESEQRFRAIFDHAGIGITTRPAQDRTLPWVQVNDHFCKLLGYTEEELLKLSTVDITPDDEQDRAVNDNERLLRGDIASYSREKQVVRKDGRRIWVLLTVTSLPSPYGSPAKLIATYQDVSGRKEAEEKVSRLNRVYAVLSGINTLIVRVHERGELFNVACRIAVEHGKFAMAWIGALDAATQDVTPVAWAGEGAAEITRVKSSAREGTLEGQGAVGRAIRERRPVFNNDFTGHAFGGPRTKEILKLGFQSQITLPLYEDQAVVATLTMYAREPNFFDEEELRLLTELAGNISFALEHMSRQQKIVRLSRIHAVMGGINALIVRVRDRDELFREACQIAVEHGQFKQAWIGVVDRTHMKIKPVASAGVTPDFLTIINQRLSLDEDVPFGNSLTAQAVREKKVAVSNDAQNDPTVAFREEHAKRGTRSMVALPLQVSDEVVSVLVLYSEETGFFNEEELRLLAELAGNVSFALEHMGRQQRIEKLSRIRAVSSEINAAIVRARNPQTLFEEACRIAVEQGRLGSAWIGSLDPATLDITPVAWAGAGSEEMRTAKSSAHDDPPRGQGAVSRAVRERRAIFNNDLSLQSFGGPRRDAVLKLGFRSMVALPLLAEDKVVGTFTLYAREPGFFDADELALLTELAGNVSFALEHMARQQRIEKLSRIRAVSSEINATIVHIHEREALLRETCRIAVEHGKFELVWIGTVDTAKQQIRPVAWNGFSPDVAHKVSWDSASRAGGTLGEAIRTAKPTVRNDIETDMTVGGMRAEALKRGCLSTVCMPLVVDNKVVALISIFAAGRGFFDEGELTLLNEVAADVSFALQAISQQEKLNYLAYYDALTGLANRSLFLERVAQHMRSAASGGHKLALFVIDLERFRNINDSLGRPAGDALLKQVAEWLTRNAGDASLVARVGEDHFAAVLPQLRQDGDAARILEKSLAAFLEHPFRLNDAVFRIALKVGVALFPDDGADAETLFRSAEAALKKAKSGGDRYLFHTQKMTDAVAGKFTLENQLRQAVDRGEFVLHYQPKTNLRSGQVTGAEALIRWNDPRTGLVPPGRFIPILEETGLIHDVGRWALKKALSDYLRWRAAGLPAVRISVNVSPLQLRNRSFIAEIEQVLGIDAHAPAGLELEITESLIMEDVKHSIASLQAIRALGVTIAIDDFGTGFSSLSYLAKLPVDTLKIDRSFVTDMTAGPDGLALVSTIITLAHSLKLKVVAEGVETEEQSRLLRLLGCDEMQGFLFSKPVPVEIFETRFMVAPSVPAAASAR